MKLQVFQGRTGEWYVRLVAMNGQIFVVSEGYTRRPSAVRAAKRMRTGVATAHIEVIQE